MMSGSETEIENEDLSEVRAGSAILPNLTIAIERDDDPGFEIWFVLFFLEFDNLLKNCKDITAILVS